jgi:hypothetical protein
MHTSIYTIFIHPVVSFFCCVSLSVSLSLRDDELLCGTFPALCGCASRARTRARSVATAAASSSRSSASVARCTPLVSAQAGFLQIADFLWGLFSFLRTRRHNKAMFSLLHSSSTTTSWVFVFFFLHARRLFLSRLVCVTKTFLFFRSMCVYSCADSVWNAVVVTFSGRTRNSSRSSRERRAAIDTVH